MFDLRSAASTLPVKPTPKPVHHAGSAYESEVDSEVHTFRKVHRKASAARARSAKAGLHVYFVAETLCCPLR